jgi:SET domain-containing protein
MAKTSKSSSKTSKSKTSPRNGSAPAKAAAGKAARPRRSFRIGRSKTGFGLFATRLIEKGDFIAFYNGRKLRNEEADRLNSRYLFELNSRWTIDGSSRRNLARYINHSCRPNAESDVKKQKIMITARKTIRPGEEITYNYGRNYFDAFIRDKGCKCVACDQKRLMKRSSVKRR